MPSEALINTLSGIIGAIVGAVGMIIAIRKMPAEIGNTESQTIKNLLETTRMLSDDNRQLHTDLDAVNAIVHGEFEIVTRVVFANPPRVISSEIRSFQPIPAADDQA